VLTPPLGHWCALTGIRWRQERGVALDEPWTPLHPAKLGPCPQFDEWLSLHERGVSSSAELRPPARRSPAPQGVVNPWQQRLIDTPYQPPAMSDSHHQPHTPVASS